MTVKSFFFRLSQPRDNPAFKPFTSAVLIDEMSNCSCASCLWGEVHEKLKTVGWKII